MQKDIENDQLYDVLLSAKKNLRLDLDIQHFENQCFSVNDLLIKHDLFLRIYELKDKFRYLIKQDSEKKKTKQKKNKTVMIYQVVQLKNLMDITLLNITKN